MDTGATVTFKWMSPLVQPLPKRDILDIAGKTLTLGAWMWADQPIKALSPVLHDAMGAYSEKVQLSEQPTYFTYEVQLPTDLERAWISFIWGGAFIR